MGVAVTNGNQIIVKLKSISFTVIDPKKGQEMMS